MKYIIFLFTLCAPATIGATSMTEVIQTVAKEERVDGKLLSAICMVESDHKPHAYNPYDGKSASIGICQIKLATARLVGFKGTAAQLMAPATNIKYAAKYLRWQMKRYDGDVTKAISAYNAGSYSTKNQQYTIKVFKAYYNVEARR